MKYKYNPTRYLSRIIERQKRFKRSNVEHAALKKAVNLLIQTILFVSKHRDFETPEMFPKSLFVCGQEKVTAEFKLYGFYLTESKSEEIKVNEIEDRILIFCYTPDGQLESYGNRFGDPFKYCYTKDEYPDLYKQLSQSEAGKLEGKILKVLKLSISGEESKVFRSYIQHLHLLYTGVNKLEIGEKIIEAYSSIRKMYLGDEVFYEKNFPGLSSRERNGFAIILRGIIKRHLEGLHREAVEYGDQLWKDPYIFSEVGFFGSGKENAEGKEEEMKKDKDKENIKPANNIPSDAKPKKRVRFNIE